MTDAVHRLRDLGPRDRLIALALALALVVAPVTSAVRLFGTWTPTGDNAFIELRARDVGTARTPLVGQPSTSGLYGEQREHVAHPGPLEFYLLSPAVRLLGGRVGMLLTAAFITSLSVLVTAWAVFRQLGRAGGLAAVVSLAAVMWTVGAAAMVNPISSVVGGFPLLCTVVLAWCLLCGDVRLLPASCVAVSFTAQQHLSVLPATAVVTAVGCVGLALVLRRQGALRDPGRRREVWRSVVLAVVIGLVLWAPVIYQQLTQTPGNLHSLLLYAGDGAREDVGYVAALRQVAHALGLPPLLGRTGVTGSDLLAPVSVLTWISALTVVALFLVGAVWWRRREPRMTALVVMTGALVVAGILNGANIPNSIEQSRIAFYHWAFALAFLELLIVILSARELVRRWEPARPAAQRLNASLVIVPTVLVLVLVPAIGNLFVSRVNNRIEPAIPKSMVDEIAAGVRRERDAIRSPTLLLSRGENAFSGVREAVAARLEAAGIEVVHPRDKAGYVDDRRLVDYRKVRSAIVIAIGVRGPPKGIPGRVIATADPIPGFDHKAFESLVRQARSAPRVVLGPALERRLIRPNPVPGRTKAERAFLAANRRQTIAALSKLREQPATILAQKAKLRLLAETPLAQPALDHRAIERVLKTFPDEQGNELTATHVSVFLLNREELLRFEPAATRTGRRLQR